MPRLTVGNTHIPYAVRYSDRAKRKRVQVTPEGVLVIAPVGTPDAGAQGLDAFLRTKRRWVFDAVRQVEQEHQKLLSQRYDSGAKLQYRGRWLMLDVTSGAVEQVQITCRSKFHVVVPEQLSGLDRLGAIRVAFDAWLRERAQRDIRRFGNRHQTALGVQAKSFQLSDAKARWGSLGRDGTVRVHWRLVQAPVAALEYVVAHELTHLLHRNHSPEFWAALARTLPDWRERKAMLERWETEHRAV